MKDYGDIKKALRSGALGEVVDGLVVDVIIVHEVLLGEAGNGLGR